MTGPGLHDGNEGPAGLNSLGALRARLDDTDKRLLDTLGERISCCIQIAEVKRQSGVPMMQSHRVGLVHQNAARYGAEQGISQDFLRRLYEVIIEETCRVEDLVIGGGLAV